MPELPETHVPAGVAPLGNVADAMAGFAAPSADERVTADKPKTARAGRKRDHRAEYEAKKQRLAEQALRERGIAPATAPASELPATSVERARVEPERTLVADDLVPKTASGVPVVEYDAKLKSLTGAIKVLGELLAMWRGPHWRITDTAPDHDASSLARVCAEAWPELLDQVQNAPQLMAITTIAAMLMERVREDRRLAALRVPVLDTAPVPASAPVTEPARPEGGWASGLR